jgi:hypothetical protein
MPNPPAGLTNQTGNPSQQPRNLAYRPAAGNAALRKNSADAIAGHKEKDSMLWTITVILFILWLLGVVSGYTLGSWIHILLVLAIILLIFNLLSGRRAI